MFKFIWQVAFPLSVAFFASVPTEVHKGIALSSGITCALIGTFSYRIDRKEEESASYKRTNYMIKRLRPLIHQEVSRVIKELQKSTSKEESDE